ncbi:4-alpha-glucanotransferase [Gordonia aichiensis]|uniref:4-alpha-glucanotransferase n=1 Tax=Gordonia aichiensis NBRC 108223 TaxID=1220583 RepID=L7KI74_9ACTN|nr:4-alpha-glucanotransferase [Gordonia aichiensis]GAC47408.1 4-alpha-glucanotransferase [Gordonia aichiensis NBRC 108223]
MTTDQVSDRLAELAHRCGVSTGYTGWDQKYHEVSRATVVGVLASLGVAADTDTDVEYSLAELGLAPWRSFLPAVTVVTEGDDASFAVHVPHGDPVAVSIRTESGDAITPRQLDIWTQPRDVDGVLTGRATFAVPSDLPQGYHEIVAANPARDITGTAPLIVTPRRLSTADDLLGEQRWGLAVQLYSVRSAASWGVGDFADLARICEIAGSVYGADFVQVNPLHAAAPRSPVEASPYLPATRRFVNPLYIRIEEIPEVDDLPKPQRKQIKALQKEFFADDLDASRIKRNKSYRAKLDVLELIHDVPRSKRREHAFLRFRKREGKGLKSFATWCVLVERFGNDETNWPDKAGDPRYLKRLRRRYGDRVDFYMWLQWICDEQLAAAQHSATSSGMDIGIITDLAVGVDRHGADAWMLGDVLASGATVGAPPDGFNQQGQGWNQPPWHPGRLAAAGYAPYRDMLRTVLRHAGGLRVDHILGLFRLWWIPDGMGPAGGTYVRYDHDALLGILALEAQRAGAVVIGEDLGVFEPTVHTALSERGILGTSILWFEHGDSAPIPPEDYRQLCLTSVTTHDLPPTLGYLAGEHIDLRSELGLLETSEADERARDARDRDAILDMARARGLLDADADLTSQDTVEALYRLIAASPSVLLGVALVDAVGERRIQNQPGTDSDQYPNWCIPLADEDGTAVLVEDLASSRRFADLVSALVSEGVGAHRRGRSDGGSSQG